jgi:hypothetical protein
MGRVKDFEGLGFSRWLDAWVFRGIIMFFNIEYFRWTKRQQVWRDLHC